MREILFRGKRVDNGEWVEGSLLYDTEQNDAYIAEYFEDRAAYLRQVIPETVGQYTGLTDKNGKRIFDGAILAEKPPMNSIAYIGRVEYSDEAGAFQIVFDTGRAFVLGTYSRSYTVIGNIHDNPELIGGDKNGN